MQLKNTWTGASTQKLVKAQRALLGLAGIDDYKIEFIKIDGDKGNTFIHTVIMGNPLHPKMLLIHGFGGGALIFYRILKHLSEYFYIYAIDLLGMGGSSRPKWIAKKPEEAEGFFVESLQMYRITIQWEQFILAGHSFGGFVAGQYAVLYQQHIQHLLLLSPAGVPELPDNMSGLEFYQQLLSKTWKGRLGFKFLKYIWNKNITPFSLARKAGILSKFMYKSYVKKRFGRKVQNQLERQWLVNYLYQVNMQSGSGEKGLMIAFKPGLWAYNPLARRFRQTKFEKPISFVYGYHDWMDPTYAYKIQHEYQERKSKVQIKVALLQNAGHHVYMDNPLGCVQAILNSILGISLPQFQTPGGLDIVNTSICDGGCFGQIQQDDLLEDEKTGEQQQQSKEEQFQDDNVDGIQEENYSDHIQKIHTFETKPSQNIRSPQQIEIINNQCQE